MLCEQLFSSKTQNVLDKKICAYTYCYNSPVKRIIPYNIYIVECADGRLSRYRKHGGCFLEHSAEKWTVRTQYHPLTTDCRSYMASNRSIKQWYLPFAVVLYAMDKSLCLRIVTVAVFAKRKLIVYKCVELEHIVLCLVYDNNIIILCTYNKSSENVHLLL